ncbi:MFS transporter [Brevundimonas sp. 2R-24]|uniref:MFS transporter n=1 Tax=Peiella sedimenti TaxID=3061083 RepID=A0ABT8SI76_9CAUL|nr:MFS transporter [Caulobacteraceae bacterium XZ-24]
MVSSYRAIRPRVCYGRRMSPAARLGIQYVWLFGGLGVSLPFAGLWMESRGLSAAAIGVILAAPQLARLLTGPLIAVWADGFRLRRSAIAVVFLAAGAAYAVAALGNGQLWLGVFWFVAATAAAAAVPLTDTLGLNLARRGGFAFSWPRGMGSAAFVAANIGAGALIARWGAEVVPIWISAVAVAGALTALWLLPPSPVGASQRKASSRDRYRGMGRLMSDPIFLGAVVAVGLIQASHAVYYAFSAIVWQGQGYSAQTSGLLWGFSVAVEIAFLWLIDPWRKRRGIGPWTLLVVGAAAGLVRWGALALEPSLLWLWPLQALHALTFAATFMASLELAQTLAPKGAATAAQMLNSTLSSGVLMGLATVFAGALFEAAGTLAYFGSAALCGLGLLLAMAVARKAARPGLPPPHR